MRQSVKAILRRLEEVRDQVEEYLDNANDTDNPNEERVERLENELDCLNQAIEELEGIE